MLSAESQDGGLRIESAEFVPLSTLKFSLVLAPNPNVPPRIIFVVVVGNPENRALLGMRSDRLGKKESRPRKKEDEGKSEEWRVS